MKRFIDTNGFHRKLEGWPIVFTVVTVVAILVGTIVELAPVFLVPAEVETLTDLQPPTPLELVGRDVYISEGCNNCHSQMVRPFRHEVERYGPYSRAEETVYETPHVWGSKRTGPDLARVGGKYPHLWHVRHMENPRSTSPNSIMPPYAHMLRKPLGLDAVPARMRTLQALGLPYTDAEIAGALDDARTQAAAIAAEVAAQGGPAGLEDREIVAVVAYLQSLGLAAKDAFDDTPTSDDGNIATAE